MSLCMRILVILSETSSIVGGVVAIAVYMFFLCILRSFPLPGWLPGLVVLMMLVHVGFMVYASLNKSASGNRVLAVMEHGVATQGVLVGMQVTSANHTSRRFSLTFSYTLNNGESRTADFLVTKLTPGCQRFRDAAWVAKSGSGYRMVTAKTRLVPESYDPDDPATRIEEVLFYDPTNPNIVALPSKYDTKVRYDARGNIISDDWATIMMSFLGLIIAIIIFIALFTMFKMIGFMRP